MKDVSIVKCVVKELGDAVVREDHTAATTVYSFIELSDGQVLKRLTVPSGLGGKFEQAVVLGHQLDLHVLKLADGSAELLALMGPDGRTFGAEMRGVESSTPILLVISCLGLGVMTLPLFGLGCFFLWLGWKLWKPMRQRVRARDYVRSLPNAILL